MNSSNKDEDDLPLKQKRLRDKKESRAKQRIRNLHHDSRSPREIAEDIEADDRFMED